jgi:hypothetical protein
MKPAVGRLLLLVVLFGGWLAYLGYLVYTRPHTAGGQPLVLSRPQFLVSTLDVIAFVDDPAKCVRIVKVLYPHEAPPVQPGDCITVADVDYCRPPARPDQPPPPPDWTGPGEYLLPLQHWTTEGKVHHYRVAPTPPSPGYSLQVPRIYPATEQTLAQYREMPKPR